MTPPDTLAGRFTALVMARVKRQLPNLGVHEYNQVYEAVLEQAEINFAAAPGVLRDLGPVASSEIRKKDEPKPAGSRQTNVAVDEGNCPNGCGPLYIETSGMSECPSCHFTHQR